MVILVVYALLLVLIARAYGRNDMSQALRWLLLLGLLLRIFAASDPYLHPWDERYHALVAKNLMEHPLKPMLYINPLIRFEYYDWSGNHIWLHKQPLTLWTLALSMKLLGTELWALRLPSVLLSTLCIGLIYGIGRRFFDKRVALLAAFFLTINGFVLEITGARSTTDHVDVFFLFFISCSIWLALQIEAQKAKMLYLCLAGLTLGGALLVKWLPALIVLPVYFSYSSIQLKRHWRIALGNSLKLLGIALLLALPWQLYIHQAFPTEASFESHYNIRHFFEPLEGHERPFYYHLNQLRVQYGDLIYLPLLWMLFQFYRKGYRNWLPVWVWAGLVLLFFSIAQTRLPAYTLIALPAFLLLQAYFYRFLSFYKSLHPSRSWLLSLLQIALVVLALRYSLERLHPLRVTWVEPTWMKEIRALPVSKQDKPYVYFGLEHAVEAMFHKELIAYTYIPDWRVLERLHQQGYVIYLKKGEELKRYKVK